MKAIYIFLACCTVALNMSAQDIKRENISPAKLRKIEGTLEEVVTKIGFKKGECAPYNNVTCIEHYNEAKSFFERGELTEEGVLKYTDLLANDIWVVNEEEVNAIYNPSFCILEIPGRTSSPITGWKVSDATKPNAKTGPTGASSIMVDARFKNFNNKDKGTNEFSSAARFRFSETMNYSSKHSQYIYGEEVGYTLPLDENTAYYVVADYGLYSALSNPNSKHSFTFKVFTPSGIELKSSDYECYIPALDTTQTSLHEMHFQFTTSVSGNYKVSISNTDVNDEFDLLISNIEFLTVPDSLTKNAPTLTDPIYDLDADGNCFTRDCKVDKIQCDESYGIEGNSYVKITPTSADARPVVAYNVPQPLLQGRRYEVKVRMAPNTELIDFALPNCISIDYGQKGQPHRFMVNSDSEMLNLPSDRLFVAGGKKSEDITYVINADTDMDDAFIQIKSEVTGSLAELYSDTICLEKITVKEIEKEIIVTDIAQIPDGEAKIDAIYAPNGMKRNKPQAGLNIIRMTDGTMRKVFYKKDL